MSHHPILMGIGASMATGLVTRAVHETMRKANIPIPLSVSALIGGLTTVSVGWHLFPDYQTSVAVGALLSAVPTASLSSAIDPLTMASAVKSKLNA